MKTTKRIARAGTTTLFIFATIFWMAVVGFAMGPNVVFSPDHGEVGEKFEIKGTMFHPDEQVFVNWDHPAAPLGTATADSAGNLTLSVDVPSGSPDGAHKVTLAGNKGSVAVHLFTIGDAAVPAAAGDHGAEGATAPAGSSFDVLSLGIGAAVGLVGALGLQALFRSRPGAESGSPSGVGADTH